MKSKLGQLLFLICCLQLWLLQFAYVVPNIQYLGRGHFDVDNDGGQRGLEELGRMVDSVSIQDHQLQGAGQLEDPLNLTLHLS